MMPFKELPMDEIVSRYLSGEDSNSIARSFDVHGMTIRNRLRELGLLRPRKKIFCLETAKKLYSEGSTCESIAKTLKVTEWAVNQQLKQAGVEMRDNNHPARREQSRRNMAERMKRMGCIRIGKHEPKFCEALRQIFGEVTPQYQVEKGGHHFDAMSNGVLWELDEEEHRYHTKRKDKDLKYDTRAKELGWEVRHVWEKDFLSIGIDKWHHIVKPT